MKKILLMFAAMAFLAVGCEKKPLETETPTNPETPADSELTYPFDGKQWTFTWEGMGMPINSVFDFGLYAEGMLTMAVDAAALVPGMTGMTPFFGGNYTITATSATSAEIKMVDPMDPSGAEVVITLTDITANSFKATNELPFGLDNTVFTLASTPVEIIDQSDIPTEPEDPEEIEALTVAEFAALEDGETVYQLTGTITRINTAYSSQYNNISFYLKDDTGEIQIYRMSCEGVADPSALTVGDEITVQGAKGTYNSTAQMAAGAVYVSHVDKAAPEEEQPEEGQVVETISGTFTKSGDVLTLTTESGITITQTKVSGTTSVNEDYNTATTLRVYKGHSLTFSGKKIVKIVIEHDSSRAGSDVTASVGTYTPGTTSSTWEGSAEEVVITNNATTENIQLRPTLIKVTYEE